MPACRIKEHMQQDRITSYIQTTLKHWKLWLFGLMIVIFIYNLSQFGLLRVSVTGTKPGDITYELSTKGQAKPKISKGKANKTMLVRKGSYQILAENNDASSMEIINTGGFLTNKKVNIALQPQRNRTFAGNSPKGCMFMVEVTLYSYECSGTLTSIQKHVPATSTTPTYVTKIPNEERNIEGTITLNDKTLVLLAPSEEFNQHMLYKIGADAVLSDEIILNDLPSDSKYYIVKYRDGFIAYNTPLLNKIFYYSSTGSKAQAITLPAIKDSTLVADSLGVKGTQIMIYYHDSNTAEGDEVIGSKDNPLKSTITIYNTTSSIHATFSGRLISPVLCGDKTICTIESGGMGVYKLEPNKQPNLQYFVPGVTSVQNLGDDIIIAQGGRFISFDASKKTGKADYTFDGSTFCGLQTIGTSYLLCIVPKSGQRTALLIDRKAADVDSVDKKIFNLRKDSSIQNVSIQGNNIFISGNFGSPIYVQGEGYINSPSTVKNVTANINKLVDSTGIDRSKYNVVIY
jgi:hypothetical protein